jgi:hypothetical protein
MSDWARRSSRRSRTPNAAFGRNPRGIPDSTFKIPNQVRSLTRRRGGHGEIPQPSECGPRAAWFGLRVPPRLRVRLFPSSPARTARRSYAGRFEREPHPRRSESPASTDPFLPSHPILPGILGDRLRLPQGVPGFSTVDCGPAIFDNSVDRLASARRSGPGARPPHGTAPLVARTVPTRSPGTEQTRPCERGKRTQRGPVRAPKLDERTQRRPVRAPKLDERTQRGPVPAPKP